MRAHRSPGVFGKSPSPPRVTHKSHQDGVPDGRMVSLPRRVRRALRWSDVPSLRSRWPAPPPFFTGAPLPTPSPKPLKQYAYVANRSAGSVSAYVINAASGALTPVTGSAFTSGNGAFGVAGGPSRQ